MGGDYAPKTVVAGTALAAKRLLQSGEPNTTTLTLLGDEPKLRVLMAKYFRHHGQKPEILHCPENIDMSESPVQAVRSKKDSSIVRGLSLSAKTPRSAFFSAGHSGAVFAAALMTMGRIDGIERPAIATAFPSLKGHCILLDAGANVECRPQHLADFAAMGAAYARIFRHNETPSVGILSNGEEESKGTELTRAADALLKATQDIRYIGYVEGKEIFSGKVDVVVTDGFTGNVVLKSLEGLAKTITSIIRSELERNLFTKLCSILSMPALKRVQKRLDYTEVGAAPLLGVAGNCFIGHGRSNAKAIMNGILRAKEAIDANLYANIRKSEQQRYSCGSKQ